MFDKIKSKIVATQKSEKENTIDVDGLQGKKQQGIPPFFLIRGAVWIILGVLLGALAILTTISLHKTKVDLSSIGLGLILFLAFSIKGVRLLLQGKKGTFFTLILTCKDVKYRSAADSASDYFNPTSQTAYRKSQEVRFELEDGNQITFIFDRQRRFMLEVAYEFYFNLPGDGKKPTLDMLDRLKIDHTVVEKEVNI